MAHSVSSAKGEDGGSACRKKATISPKTWLEPHAPAEAAKKMLSKFVISLALRNFSVMK